MSTEPTLNENFSRYLRFLYHFLVITRDIILVAINCKQQKSNNDRNIQKLMPLPVYVTQFPIFYFFRSFSALLYSAIHNVLEMTLK